MRRKALLAIVFAGGMLGAQPRALSERLAEGDVDTNPEAQVDIRVAIKTEADNKADSTGDTKTDAKPEVEGDTKNEAKTDANSDTNNKTKIETEAKNETKAEVESKPTAPLLDRIAGNGQLTPEKRAYYMLMMANNYLDLKDKVEVERLFDSAATDNGRSWAFRKPEVWDKNLSLWSDQVSGEKSKYKYVGNGKKIRCTISSKPIFPKENSVLANTAAVEALDQLGKGSDPFAKVNLYFIAARLFEKMDNIDAKQKCDRIVEQSIRACEGNAPIGPRQAQAACSILNSMANSLIPVKISDQIRTTPGYERQSVPVKPYSEAEFKESEKLKLRGLAIADKLNSKDHVRRKAHRDLTLWYMELGKFAQANKQKQTLFDLVGIDDDSILYPQSAGCGHVVWWQAAAKERLAIGCGMG